MQSSRTQSDSSSPSQIYEADYRVSPEGEIERRDRRPSRWKRVLGPLLPVLIFVATKLKFILSALKGIKFFGTGISALLSVGAYAMFFGWQFGVGLVLLIFIHELGHVIVLRRYGVPASAPIFIPFMGAVIGMKQLPKNAVMEAHVGLGGPIIGSLGAAAAYLLYLIDGHGLFLVMAYIGVLINLFNLLPVLPLDGGRAVGAISRWFWVLGYAGLIGLIFLRPSPLLLIILLIGAPEVWNAIRSRGDREYYRVPFGQRLSVAGAYFGLMLILGVALYELEPLVYAARPL
jgi:Zn-dependent protease